MQPKGTRLREVLPAFAAVWGTGFLSQAISPFLVGSVVESLGLSATEAGRIQSVELLMAAITSLALSRWIPRLPKRRLAISGAILAGCMHAVSGAMGSGSTLLAIRAIAGIGAGMTLGAGNSLIAANPEPERLYARMFMVTAVAYCGLFLSLGYVGSRWGIQGTYGLEAVWVFGMIPLLRKMSNDASLPTAHRSDWSGIPATPTMLMFVVLMLFEIWDVGTWAFSERIAHSLGIQMASSAWALASSSALAVAGAFAVSLIGFRFGRTWPAVVSLIAFATICLVILTANRAQVFIVAILVYQGVYAFALPNLYGIAGAIDPKGRAIVAISGGALIGAAIGPYVVGRLSDTTGFASIGWLAFSSLMFVALLLIVALRELRLNKLKVGSSQP